MPESSLKPASPRHIKAAGCSGDKACEKFKQYAIGYLHIDIAVVQGAQGKLYLFVPIDRISKFAYAQTVRTIGPDSGLSILAQPH